MAALLCALAGRHASANGLAIFKGNSAVKNTTETMSISKKMRLEATGGTVRLGVQ